MKSSCHFCVWQLFSSNCVLKDLIFVFRVLSNTSFNAVFSVQCAVLPIAPHSCYTQPLNVCRTCKHSAAQWANHEKKEKNSQKKPLNHRKYLLLFKGFMASTQMQLLSWYSVLYGGTTAKGRVIWTGSMIDLLKGSVGGAGGSWGPCCIWCLSTLSGIKEGGGRLAVGEGTGRREKVEEGRGRRKRRQSRKRSWTKRKRFRALCCNLQRKLSIDFWLTTQRDSAPSSQACLCFMWYSWP